MKIVILVLVIILVLFRIFPSIVEFLVKYWLIPVANLLNEIKNKIERWLNR